MDNKDKHDIQNAIEIKIGEVRTDGIDLSYGELISLHSANPPELIITPDFQRYFRWDNEQRSRLIESILLELPIPQIFLIETDDGVLELIDGLQRISSVIQFINPEKLSPPNNLPLKLQGCDIVSELNGMTFSDLPLSLKHRIKRTAVRACVIKRQSSPTLRYSMFKRLNTGGSALSAQEVRNCTSRMVGQKGGDFYSFLQDCAKTAEFKKCTESLADTSQREDEELVLRFFTLKNYEAGFEGSVKAWLDNYMEKVLFDKLQFDYKAEKTAFERAFGVLSVAMGRDAFVKFRDGGPMGGLAPAYFEAVSVGASRAMTTVDLTKHTANIKQKIVRAVQSEDFKDQVGPGANSKTKLAKRVLIVQNALTELGQ